MKTPIVKITKHQRRISAKFPFHYWFCLVAANGEKLATSELYTTARARNKTVNLLLSARLEAGK